MKDKMRTLPIFFALLLIGGGVLFSLKQKDSGVTAFTHPVFAYTFTHPDDLYCAERLHDTQVVSCTKDLNDAYDPYGIDVFTQRVAEDWTLDRYVELEVESMNTNTNITLLQMLIQDDGEVVAGQNAIRMLVDFQENTLDKAFYTEQVAFLKDDRMYAIQYNSHDPEKPFLELYNELVESYTFEAL